MGAQKVIDAIISTNWPAIQQLLKVTIKFFFSLKALSILFLICFYLMIEFQTVCLGLDDRRILIRTFKNSEIIAVTGVQAVSKISQLNTDNLRYLLFEASRKTS